MIPTAPIDSHVIKSGHLDVGDGHQIYWEDWGNPSAPPTMCLHGGPGGGFSPSHKSLFDPARHHVIFHDQRGCGQSLPFANTDYNTTQDLVADIEKLREHLRLDRVAVVGGSWGSTLALIYALAHPERVTRLLLWSIYLARQLETDLMYTGYPRYNFPEAWQRFISLVPANNRESGTTIIQYYADLMRSADPEKAYQAAVEWALWEMTLVSLHYEPLKLERDVKADPNVKALALMESHYFLNQCFVPENYILDNLAKIQAIPCTLIQGRFDFCTPPAAAIDLAQAYGAQCILQIVNTSHLRSEPEMLAALRATVNASFS